MMKRAVKTVLGILAATVLLSAAKGEVRAAEAYKEIASDYEWEVLKIVNEERIKEGQEAISLFEKIQSATDVRAKEIIESFSHTRPDGSSCFTILEEKKIAYWSAGENIAAGQGSPASVMYSWMNSPGHRGNILSGSYDHIGVGHKTGGSYGNYWVQLFVGGCEMTSVEIEEDTRKFAKGTSIDSMNRYLVAECEEHGISYAPVTSSMCKGYDANGAAEQTVTVTYRGESIPMKVYLEAGEEQEPENPEEDPEEEPEEKPQKPAKVTGLKAKKTAKTAVTLSWKKTAGDGYEIFRSTKKNGSYKKVKTLTMQTTENKGTQTYKNTKLKSKKIYYYKVRAFRNDNGKKLYGKYSNILKVKTK